MVGPPRRRRSNGRRGREHPTPVRTAVVGSVLLVTLSVLFVSGLAGGAAAVDELGVTGGATVNGTVEQTVDPGDTTFETDVAGPEVDSVSSPGADIELRQELGRITDRNGIYEARHEYAIPDSVGILEVRLPEDATLRSEEGFVREDERTFRWDGATARPTLSYELSANRSVDQTGPIAGPGRLIYVDVGEWGLVSQPRTSHRWGWQGSEPVGFEREVTVDGPGAAGDVMAFFGEYEEYTHEAHGQKFRLVVPEQADLAEEPTDLLRALEGASDALRVGERDEEVFMIATPTATLDWGVRGLQSGPADLWVRDVETLSDPDSVWLHEYVHTRQRNTFSEDLRWFTEATATYYAALLALEREDISFEQFRDRLAVGADERHFSGSILSDPASWRANANYHVGALVSGALDLAIRRTTERESNFQDVFRELNARDDLSGGSELREVLDGVAGAEAADLGEALTTTTERPAMWDGPAHETAFEGLDPARITYTLADRPVEVTGLFRNRSLAAGDRPVLVPGERLAFGVNATNFGEQRGDFEAVLRVSDRAVANRTGSLDGGETTTLPFEHAFGETGEFRLAVGDATLDVTVREPAEPTVAGLSANRTEANTGESLRLSATVENTASWPAAGTVSFTRNGAEISSESVRLDAGETRNVTSTLRLEEAGTYVFGLGNGSSETVVVTVEEPSQGKDSGEDDGDSTDGSGTEGGESGDTSGDDERPSDSGEDGTAEGNVDDSGDGFTVGVAVLGLSVTLLTMGLRRRRGSV